MREKRYFLVPLALALVAMVWMPFQGVLALSSQRLHEAAIRETIDEDSGEVIVRCERNDTSPLSISRGGQPLAFSASGEAVAERLGGEGATLVAIRESRSLSRRVMTFAIDFPRRPRYLSLSLESDSEIVFHDASFPFEQSLDGRTVAFSIGTNPPEHFELKVVVDISFSGSLRLEASYDSSFGQYASSGGHSISSTSCLTEKVVTIERAQ